VGALVCMVTMIYYNTLIFGIFVGFLALGYGYFLVTGHQRQEGAAPLVAMVDDDEAQLRA
jgi:ethanolamine permease